MNDNIKRVKLVRITKHLLRLTVDGAPICPVRQAPGNGRIYTAVLAHGETISGLGQRDLIARIADRL
jgi:hypothetical protein